MKKFWKLILGALLVVSAIVLSLIFPSILEGQMDSRVEKFDIGSTILKDVQGTPPPSPSGEVPMLMGNLTFLSLLWDKLSGGNQFPWETYYYLPAIEMVDLISKDIAIDSQGLYLPSTGMNVPLISGETIQDVFDPEKLYRDEGFDIHNLEKKQYIVEDLLTQEKIPVFYLQETTLNDINTYVYRGYRNNTDIPIQEVLDLLNISPDIFINGSGTPTNGGPTEPLQKRFSGLINTTVVTERQVIHYYMAKPLGVPLNIMMDYDVYVDFPLISELMLNNGFIKPVMEGYITINPPFRSLVNDPGKIKQVVIFNTTISPDDSNIAIVHQTTYFANASSNEKLPEEFQLNRSPIFAVDRQTLSYTPYPGTMNRTGLFIPLCTDDFPRTIPLWDEVTNTSGVASYNGILNKDNDTFIQYTLYQEDVVFTDIPLFQNISTLLNLDILYDGTTTYVLNRTTGFLYDIMFQGEFKLYLPFNVLPLEISLASLSLSFNSSLKEFMKDASVVAEDFKPITGKTLNVGTLHLEYTPSLTNYFSTLRGEALHYINIFTVWLPLTLGVIGGIFIFMDIQAYRKRK